jgi:hypothetical protein
MASQLDLCQQTTHSHKKALQTLGKQLSVAKGSANQLQGFLEEFRDHVKRVLVVAKKEPAVERVVEFVTKFAGSQEEVALDLLRVRGCVWRWVYLRAGTSCEW